MEIGPSLSIGGAQNRWDIQQTKPALWLDASRGVGTTGARSLAQARGEDFNGALVSGHALNDISMSAWCYPVSSPSVQSPFIFYTGGNGATYPGVCLRQSQTNRYPMFYFATGVDGTNEYIQQTTSMPLNAWTHLFGYVDRLNKMLYLYVNGVLANSASFAGNGSSFNLSSYLSIGGMLALPKEYLYDGRLSRCGYFIGTLDHAAAAAHLFNQGNGRFWAEVTQADLIAAGKHYYNLNESSLSPAIDAIGTNDCAISGVNLLTNPGFETAGSGGADVFASWTESAAAPATVTNGGAGNARSGSSCVCLTSPAGEYCGIVAAPAPCVVGRSYTFSWYTKALAGSGTVTVEEIAAPSTHTPGLTYAQRSVTFTATLTGITLKRNNPGTYYFDDISLTSAQIDSAQGPREATASDIEGGFHGVLTNMDTVNAWSTDTPDGSYTAIKADSGKDVNLCANGGFETLGTGTGSPPDTFANWVESVTGSSTISADTTEKYSGTTSCKLSFPGGDNVFVAQNIGELGKSYTIEFWAKSSAAAMLMYVAHGTAFQGVTTTTEWARYSVTLTPASNVQLRFNRNANPGAVWIDDVVVKESAATGTMTGFTDIDAAHVDGPNGHWGPAITDRGSSPSQGWLLSSVKDSRSASVPSSLNTRVWDEYYTEPTATGSRSLETDQRFQMASVIPLGTGNFTLEAWCYPTFVSGNPGYLLAAGGTAAIQPGCSISRSNSGTISVQLADGTNIVTFSSPANLVAAYKWSHILVTCDRAANSCYLWVDGALVGGSAGNLAAFGATSITPTAAGRCNIGTYVSGDGTNTWRGGVAMARIAIGDALTSAEIAETYNGGKGRTLAELSIALRAKVDHSWALDEAGNTNAVDSVGGNTGTQAGTSTNIASGPSPFLPAFDCTLVGYTSSPRSADVPTALVGKCKSLQWASGGYATAGVKTVSGMGGRSFGFWFKRVGNPSGSEYIITESALTTAHNGYSASISSAGTLQLAIMKGHATDRIFLLSKAATCDGNWHHVMLTWDGTTDTDKAIMYFDGVSAATATATATAQASASSYNTQLFGYNGVNSSFQGLLCRPQIFAGRALTAGEVATLYAGGDVTEGLTAEWRFNEPDAIAVPFEHALKCDGANTIVDTGAEQVGAGAATLSAWAYVTSFGEGGFGRILDNGKALLCVGAGGQLRYSSEGTIENVQVAPTVPTAAWVHLSVTRDMSGHSQLYINGTRCNVTRSNTNNSGTPASGTGSLMLANRAALDRTFDGLIGQVRIDSGVLTQAQIRQLALGQSPATPRNDWRFADPLDLPYLDGCRAVRFDGTDDYIAAANGITAYPFTLAGWVRSVPTGAAQGFLSVHVAGNQYWFVGCGSTGMPVLSARNTTEYTATGSVVFADGSWHHIAGVYTSATDRQLYVDGNLAASNTTSVDFATSADVFIGMVRTSVPKFNANSDQADLRIYSTALTQAQIRSLIAGTDFRTGISAQWKFGETPRSVPSARAGTRWSLMGWMTWFRHRTSASQSHRSRVARG
jgi:hypothetical protein